MIPKIIHQTWKDSDVPEHLIHLTESWKDHHIDWEFRLWTDDDNRRFIEMFYPDFLNVYDSYPTNIQRIDAVRYFVLYHYGGVFIDLDFECFLPIDTLIKDRDCLFGVEPLAHAQRFDMPFIVCNAFMAAEPKHGFIKYVCTALPSVKQGDAKAKINVLQTTGPFLLTSLYNRYQHKDEITLVPSELIYPLTIEEVRRGISEGLDEGLAVKLKNAVALHYFWGSWWDEF